MFFVFGPSGQIYRGGGGKLAQLAPVQRVQRPQALGTRAMEPYATSALPVAPKQGATPQQQRLQEAAAAYVRTEQGPAAPRQPVLRVADMMTLGAVSVPPDILAHEAWLELARQRVAQAPVVNSQGCVVGLLLRADMAPLDLLPQPAAVPQTIAHARRAVSEVMVSPVPTVAPDTELRRVAPVLLDTGLPGLPVTDEHGLLVGYVSRTDILRAVVADPPLDLWS
ncbi:MAG: CBS domain-containing protein [Proteobacteria bacterium]|nr:CBS domain-containing protein [Pseudomonadota bacterium]MBS0495150.1 CBS domain-containing protein [Pseudomonadota bacterium]